MENMTDITSSEFSLENNVNINTVLGKSIISKESFVLPFSDIWMNIYFVIGIILLLVVIGVVIYKYFITKSKKVTFQENENIHTSTV